jgi:diaminopimelate decarboxylase
MRARFLPAGLATAARDYARRRLAPLARRLTPRRVDLPLSTWDLARDPGGSLTLDGVGLEGLLSRWGSPLHVLDARRLLDNARRFTARPAGATRACEVFYSYKTNPVPGVLRLLHAAGVGAEVVSAYELWLAFRLGVPPAAVVYNGPAKSEPSLREALERGVGLVNLNARPDVADLAALARSMGKRPRVGLRVVVPGAWGSQLGERVDNGAAFRAFEEALSHPELEVVALHTHRGAEIASRRQLETFLAPVLAFTDQLHERLGLELEVLDIGGSLACPTVARHSPTTLRLSAAFGCDLLPRPPESVLSIDDYVAAVGALVERHCAAAGRRPPRIFLEPGRALTGNSQLLLCRVMGLRDPDERGLAWAMLDAGVNVAEAVRGEYHQIFPLASPDGAPQRLYRLAGPTCSPGDVLAPAWRLPELARGDGVAIMDSGAYFVPFSTTFSFPRPGIVVVGHGAGAQPIRRPEAFEDMVALDGGGGS